MQHILYIMLNDGVPILPNEKLDKLFPHLEEVGIPDTAAVKRGKKLIKTHLPSEMLSMSIEAKYIFIARNPKDCVVSFFHHTRGFPKHYDFEDGDFDVYFDLFCEGKVDFGSYFKTLRSWFDRKEEENVLFLTYEKIQEDKAGAIRTIAKFIGENIEKKLSQENGVLMDKILKYSSLEEMKKNPLRFCSARKSAHEPFIRSGKVGGWDELVTKEQGERLDEMMANEFTQEELQYLGAKYY